MKVGRNFAIVTATLCLCASVCSSGPGRCFPGSGVCQELEQDSANLELLQVRVSKAGSEGLGAKAPATKNKLTFDPAGRLREAAGTLRDSLSKALDTTALAAITSAVNSTLVMLDEKAGELLEHCQEFSSGLIQQVNAAGDRKIETLESLVMQNMDSLAVRWSAISQALSSAGPPISKALKSFGVQGPSEDSLEEAAKMVSEALENLTQTIESLANASSDMRQRLLMQANATAEAGLSQAREFEKSMVEFLHGVLTKVGDELGVNVTAPKPVKGGEKEQIYDTLAVLMEESTALAQKMHSALGSLFSGSYRAASIAVSSATVTAAKTWGLGVTCVLALAPFCRPA